MIIRAKTKTLFQGKKLTDRQQYNTDVNIQEIDDRAAVLKSLPRRLVFELTNVCNLNCTMCGRNAVEFEPTVFRLEWLRWFEPILDTVEEVTLMGWGEPTIHPQFSEMLKIIDKYSARKYFCTNGMNLDKIKEDIFRYHVDVFAVSLDGATDETNSRIRRGSDIKKITESLKDIVQIKNEKGLKYPHINFVFCAMKSNLHELPDLVKLAGEMGINEVKVVYLTAFDTSHVNEVLYDCQNEVSEVFSEAEKIGNELNVLLKFPYIQGEDPAEARLHKDCFVSWRDFFLGSDGCVRPCMSTPVKFFKFDMNKSFEDMWNNEDFIRYRQTINDERLMDHPCRRCYQSSHCNWNQKHAYLQADEVFAPLWKK